MQPFATIGVILLAAISFFAMDIVHGLHVLVIQAQATSPPWLEWKISVGNIVTTMVVLIGLVPVARMCRAVQKSVSIFLDEHDVLWEDYNVRHGLNWRRSLGRTQRTVTRGNYPDDPPQKAQAATAGGGRTQ